MPEDFEREEAAFRAALRRDVAGESFAPLDPAAVAQRPGRGPGRWAVWAGAAAAVVALVVAAGVVVVSVLTPTAPGALTAGASAERGGSAQDAAPAAPGPALGSALAPPAAGFRWESFRNVVVQVPVTWGYALSPGPDWCVTPELERPETPFVDLARGPTAVASWVCPEVFEASRQQLHVSFLPAGDQPSPAAVAPWTYSSRVVGEAALWVLAPPEDRELVRTILDSAQLVTLDHNGCSVEYPATTAVDLSALRPADLTVCLYDPQVAAGTPGLLASVALTGEAAGQAWQAILAAPGGGGPDGTSEQCRPGVPPDVSAVLVVAGRRVEFGFAGCAGNGLVDAGATGGLRQVTPQLCRALIRPPLWFTASSGPQGDACLAAIQPR